MERSAAKSTPTVEMRRVVSASEALGEIDATDPLSEIEAPRAGWASSAWCRSNSIGDR